MRQGFQYGLLLSMLLCLVTVSVRAEDDPFASDATPTPPAFFSDHSNDDTDIDGVSKKFKKNDENSDQDFLSKDDDSSKDKDPDDDLSPQPTKTTQQKDALSSLKKTKTDDDGL